MPLPREPRQKMINVMYLVLTAILALNVSNEVINAFKVVNNSLVTSNENITAGNETIYKSLEEKLKDEESKKLANIWQPKAEEARKLSAKLYNYIDSLKLALKNAADLRMVWDEEKGDSVEDYRFDNLDASTRLFETKGLGEVLEAKLRKYKEDMLSIDSSIRAKFENNFPIKIDTLYESIEGKKKNFTQTFFHMTPAVAALTMLSKFQNGVKNAESEIITYAHNQIGAVEVVYDEFAALVGQSSNYVMPGDKIEITAGVGAYNAAAKPVVTIGGKPVPVGPKGVAEYTITARGAGSHSLPVVVNFTKPDGTKATKTFPLKYTVGTPGGSAVMLDKMNVFYIGVDNPVTISSGTGWDKTNVSMKGGDLIRKGVGEYTVRVKDVGKAYITVNADGKSSTFDFRKKQVPPPILMVGPSEGGRVRSVVFKNQSFARAELKHFDFEYRYHIVSATVYFTGANFSNLQTGTINDGNLGSIKKFMDMCIPGTTVIFDNVRVQGPGGPVISIPGAGFVLY